MNLPGDFINSVSSLLGSESKLLFDAIAEETPVSIRLNPFKQKRNPMQLSSDAQEVAWSNNGFYLSGRPAYTFDPLFHTGYYYVQEASSMFIEHVVKCLVEKPSVCLDLSAAPGGKSIGLLSALPEGSMLVCNEIVRQRANVLSETITKFGLPNTVVTNNAPKDFSNLDNFFDLILVDAPCSGEGMFRKDEIAIEEWSTDNVQMCASRQKDILGDIWDSLKPGGLIIYSTCTYNTSENEDNALWIASELGAEFVGVEVNTAWGISPSVNDNVKAFRFYPHKTKGEGLFVTVLRKNEEKLSEGSLESHSSRKRSKKNQPVFVKDSSPYSKLFLNPEQYEFQLLENKVIALPKEHSEIISTLGDHLKIISQGIEVGEIKGRDFIPSQSLALSTDLKTDAFNSVEVGYHEAITYLRNQAVQLPDATKGFLLITYKNEPLGFVKNLGNRANNLYPKEWRIRSGYLPDTPTELLFNNTTQ